MLVLARLWFVCEHHGMLALLAVAGVLMVCAGAVLPVCAVVAMLVRQTGEVASSPEQQRLQQAILLTALTGLMLWLEWFLVAHHGRLSGPLVIWLMIGLPGFCLVSAGAGAALALASRGRGRTPLLAGYLLLLVLAVAGLVWALVASHQGRHQPFFSQGSALPGAAVALRPATSGC